VIITFIILLNKNGGVTVRKIRFVTLASLILCFSFLLAEGSTKISYQGVLTNDDGTLMTGVVDLSFAFYTQQVGGSSFCNLTHAGTDLGTQGVFSVNLDLSQCSGGVPAFDNTYYMGITVDSDQLPNRIEITSAGYALNARHIQGESPDGNLFNAEGDVGIGITSPLAKLHIENDTSNRSSLFIKSASGQSARNVWVQDADGETQLTIKADGDIGIGTDSPNEKLEVAGKILSTSGMKIIRNDHYANYEFSSNNGSDWWMVGNNDDPTTFQIRHNNVNKFQLNHNGNVGIGIDVEIPPTQLTLAAPDNTEAGVRFLGNGLPISGSRGLFVGYNNQAYFHNHEPTKITFRTDATERFNISGTSTSLYTPNSSMPNIELNSVGNNDEWDDQGSYISIGEAPDPQDGASARMVYHGSGTSYFGSGEMDSESGKPFNSLAFDYDSERIWTNSNIGIGSNFSQAVSSDAKLSIYDAGNSDIPGEAHKLQFGASSSELFGFRSDSGNDHLVLDKYWGGWSAALAINRNSGNVGIGTTDPNEKLEVFNGNIKLGSNANSPLYLKFERNSSAIGEISTANSNLTIDANNANDIQFRMDPTSESYNVLLHLDDGGNVGVGTSTPGANFEVNFPLGSGSSASDDYGLLLNAANRRWKMTVGGKQATSEAHLQFLFKNHNATSFSDMLTLTHTGNVGIGNDDPDAKLDVAGSLHLDGIDVDGDGHNFAMTAEGDVHVVGGNLLLLDDGFGMSDGGMLAEGDVIIQKSLTVDGFTKLGSGEGTGEGAGELTDYSTPSIKIRLLEGEFFTPNANSVYPVTTTLDPDIYKILSLDILVRRGAAGMWEPLNAISPDCSYYLDESGNSINIQNCPQLDDYEGSFGSVSFRILITYTSL